MHIRIMTAAAAALCSGCTEGPETPPANGVAETVAEERAAVPEVRGQSAPENLATPAAPAGNDPAKQASVSPCLIQDGRRIDITRIKAVGTEPFWAARVEGRCVTYSHPDDQGGTRVWTRFSGAAENGTWTGSLGGKPFVMRTRQQPGCSDGMSDRRYPIAVTLEVEGEQRSGCAEPA